MLTTTVLWVMIFNFNGNWGVYDTTLYFTKDNCEYNVAKFVDERKKFDLPEIKFTCVSFTASPIK